MCVLNVLNVTGGATWRVGSCGGCVSFKDLRVVALRAGCARVNSINIGAHVTGFVTTAARHHLINAICMLNASNAGNDANTIDVDGMELSISPLLWVVLIGPCLL